MRAPASMRASSKRSSTSAPSVRTCSRSAGRYRSGSASPSSSASSIACMFASGVRRSWLAQATSWRRASKSPSTLAAISLKLVASSASSVGPSSGARAARSPRARAADAERTRSIEPPIRRATSSAPASAAVEDATATRRIVMSWPELNIATPESVTAARGRQTAVERERDELQPDAAETRKEDSRDQPGAEGCDRHDDRERDHGAAAGLAVGRLRRREAVADAPDRLQIAGMGGIVLDLLPQPAARGRSRCPCRAPTCIPRRDP